LQVASFLIRKLSFRLAVAIADDEYTSIKESNQELKEHARVKAKHIEDALQKMLTSTLTLSIHKQALHARIFLAAVLLELRQTGLAESNFDEVMCK
jgi:hypothetical protein